MKKYFVILVTIICLFLSIDNIKALTCRYGDDNLKVTFVINKDGSAKRARVSGANESKFSDEPVENWKKTYLDGVTFVGKDYYEKNYKCPKYAILERAHGLKLTWLYFVGIDHLFVADEKNYNSIKDAIDKKYDHYNSSYPMTLELIETPSNNGQNENQDRPYYCTDFKDKASCENSSNYINYMCVWNKQFNYCNVDNLVYVQCGDAYDIPYQVPGLVSFLYNLLKIATPIILIVVSIISLLKAMASSSEDEMKKAQKSLVRKVIAAVMVFLVLSIVQFVIGKVAEDKDNKSITACLSCFLTNNCSNTAYYKTNIAQSSSSLKQDGQYVCTSIDGEPLNGDGTCPEDE